MIHFILLRLKTGKTYVCSIANASQKKQLMHFKEDGYMYVKSLQIFSFLKIDFSNISLWAMYMQFMMKL